MKSRFRLWLIFSKTSSLNLSLQGSNINVYIVQDRIELFIKHLAIGKCVSIAIKLSALIFFMTSWLSLHENVKNTWRDLEKSWENISLLCPIITIGFTIPSKRIILESTLSVNEKEQLFEIIDFQLQESYKSLSLIGFWLSLRKEFPVLVNKA